ncbi:MAG: SH3 domain-containing protein [Rhizobiaceae bacterium]
MATVSPLAAVPAMAQTTGAIQHGQSGLPLPRFVSLKSGRVNLRIGPGRDYAVDWLYLKPGLPLEIIQEYDNWRRVRDSEGTEGWIYQSLLSGRRTGMAAPWNKGKDANIPLQTEPEKDARVVAVIEPGAIGRIHLCNGEWCEMTFAGHKGWIRQALVWGAYPGETYED